MFNRKGLSLNSKENEQIEVAKQLQSVFLLDVERW